MESPRPALSPSRASFLLASVLVFLGVLAVFRRVIVGGELFVGRDTLRVYYPVAKYWAERVRALEFPEWYPYDSLGQPFVGMVVSGALHPSKLLYLLMPLGPALSVNTLLCYPIAAAGAYRCARAFGFDRSPALFAGITYCLSGYLVGISNNLLYLMSAATFPWVFWAAHRYLASPSTYRLVVAGLLLASILFAGDPQSFAVTGAGVLLLFLATSGNGSRLRGVSHALLFLATGLLLSAPQLLPALHTRAESLAGKEDLAVAQVYSLHPLRLLELPLGPLFLDPGSGLPEGVAAALVEPWMKGLWVGSISIGVLALLLAGLALAAFWKHSVARWMAALVLLIVTLALGSHLPVYGWVFEWLPPWRGFRFPEKLVPFALFLLSLAAGAGLSKVLSEEVWRRRLLLAGAIALLVAVIGWGAADGIGELLAGALRAGDTLGDSLGVAVRAMSLTAAVVLGLGGLALTGLRPPLHGPILCTLQVALLVTIHGRLPQTSALDVLGTPSPFVEEIRNEFWPSSRLGGPRVLAAARPTTRTELPGLSPLDSGTAFLSAALEPSTPALFSLESANYYLPAPSARVFTGYRADGLWFTKLAWLYGTEFVAVDHGFVARARVPREQILVELPALQLALLRRPDARPRAYMASATCVPDAQSALARLQRGPSLAPTEALLECGSGMNGQRPDRAAFEPVQVLAWAPERIELETNNVAAGVLILNDAHYDGWTATVDGEAVSILPANLAVRGVPLPPGRHTVQFTYRAPGLRSGAAVTGGVLCLLLLAILAEKRRRRGPVHEERG